MDSKLSNTHHNTHYMNNQSKLKTAFTKLALMAAPLAMAPALGAMGGYRAADDSPEEKIEGMGRGALRGTGTLAGAAAGGALGARAGMSSGNMDTVKLLAALGLLGGGAAGYAGTGALMGPSTSDKKRKRKEVPSNSETSE